MDITNRIHEIAVKHCADYPNINEAHVSEQLYAIEATLSGILAANNDCHKLIEILLEKCDTTIEEAVKIWENNTGKNK